MCWTYNYQNEIECKLPKMCLILVMKSDKNIKILVQYIAHITKRVYAHSTHIHKKLSLIKLMWPLKKVKVSTSGMDLQSLIVVISMPSFSDIMQTASPKIPTLWWWSFFFFCKGRKQTSDFPWTQLCLSYLFKAPCSWPWPYQEQLYKDWIWLEKMSAKHNFHVWIKNFILKIYQGHWKWYASVKLNRRHYHATIQCLNLIGQKFTKKTQQFCLSSAP